MMKMLINSTLIALLLVLYSSVQANELSQRALHPNISGTVPEWCSKPVWCDHLVSIDCRSSLDGPLYYFDNVDGSLLMRCGGDCLIPEDVKKSSTDPFQCKTCPPVEWQNCIKKNKSNT